MTIAIRRAAATQPITMPMMYELLVIGPPVTGILSLNEINKFTINVIFYVSVTFIQI